MNTNFREKQTWVRLTLFLPFVLFKQLNGWLPLLRQMRNAEKTLVDVSTVNSNL